jgi:NadR type nicotinamide-nucleotide adenylyltransferase
LGSIIKIAITGPESTGKSRLASQLAQHFNTVFVPEYARDYIGGLDRPYQESDLLLIAKGQLNLGMQLENQANQLLFFDTEMTVIKIWSLHKYGRCHPFILQKLQEQNFDLILLCDVDLPWEPDKQREHPKHRKFFFDWYLTELNLQGVNYAVVSGKGDERLNNAINEVDKILHLKI